MKLHWIALCLAVMTVAGCTDKPSLFPNSDPKLRKTKAEFAEEAKKLFPYPGPAAETANGAAEIDVEFDKVRLTNLSDTDWLNIDLWVNGGYVVHVPKIEAKGGVRTLDFQMIYNAKGDHLPTNNDKHPVTLIEIRLNGVMYKVPHRFAL